MFDDLFGGASDPGGTSVAGSSTAVPSADDNITVGGVCDYCGADPSAPDPIFGLEYKWSNREPNSRRPISRVCTYCKFVMEKCWASKKWCSQYKTKKEFFLGAKTDATVKDEMNAGVQRYISQKLSSGGRRAMNSTHYQCVYMCVCVCLFYRRRTVRMHVHVCVTGSHLIRPITVHRHMMCS